MPKKKQKTWGMEPGERKTQLIWWGEIVMKILCRWKKFDNIWNRKVED